jgi:hypothetical protein
VVSPAPVPTIICGWDLRMSSPQGA